MRASTTQLLNLPICPFSVYENRSQLRKGLGALGGRTLWLGRAALLGMPWEAWTGGSSRKPGPLPAKQAVQGSDTDWTPCESGLSEVVGATQSREQGEPIRSG